MATFTYKTSKGEGSVEITKSTGGVFVDFGTGAIECVLADVNGKVYIHVSMDQLFRVGALGAPNKKVMALIELVGETSRADVYEAAGCYRVKSDGDKGVWGNGVWYSTEQVNKMSYSERVASGINGE